MKIILEVEIILIILAVVTLIVDNMPAFFMLIFSALIVSTTGVLIGIWRGYFEHQD